MYVKSPRVREGISLVGADFDLRGLLLHFNRKAIESSAGAHDDVLGRFNVEGEHDLAVHVEPDIVKRSAPVRSSGQELRMTHDAWVSVMVRQVERHALEFDLVLLDVELARR